MLGSKGRLLGGQERALDPSELELEQTGLPPVDAENLAVPPAPSFEGSLWGCELGALGMLDKPPSTEDPSQAPQFYFTHP